MKKNIKLLVLVLLVVVIAGCSLLKDKTKTYTQNGISVTMNDGFTLKELDNVTVYLEGEDAIFTALKENFTTLEPLGITSESNLQNYAKAVIEANSLTSSIKEKDGVTYFTYTKEVNNNNFYYLATVYKSKDAFWLINFACEAKNKDTFEPRFIEWAKTVTFE